MNEQERMHLLRGLNDRSRANLREQRITRQALWEAQHRIEDSNDLSAIAFELNEMLRAVETEGDSAEGYSPMHFHFPAGSVTTIQGDQIHNRPQEMAEKEARVGILEDEPS